MSLNANINASMKGKRDRRRSSVGLSDIMKEDFIVSGSDEVEMTSLPMNRVSPEATDIALFRGIKIDQRRGSLLLNDNLSDLKQQAYIEDQLMSFDSKDINDVQDTLDDLDVQEKPLFLSDFKIGVECITMNKDATTIATGASDGIVYVWHLKYDRHNKKEYYECAHKLGYVEEEDSDNDRMLCIAIGKVNKWDLLIEENEQNEDIQEEEDTEKTNFTNLISEIPVEFIEIIVVGSKRRHIKIWNAENGELIKSVRKHSAEVLCIDMNDKYIVSGSRDKTVRIHSLLKSSNNIKQSVWKGHHDQVTGIKIYDRHINARNTLSSLYLDDHPRVISCSYDCSIILWDLYTGRKIQTLESKSGIIDPCTRKLYKIDIGHVRSVNISPTGIRAVTGFSDSLILVWDLETGMCIQDFEGHTDAVTSVTFTPDGNNVVSSSLDGTLRVWDLETGKTIYDFEGNNGAPVNNACSSTSMKNLWIIGACSASSIQPEKSSVFISRPLLFGDAIKCFIDHRNIINWVCCGESKSDNPSDYLLYSACGNSLRKWDNVSNLAVGNLMGHSEEITCIAISSDNKFLASGGLDETVIVWDLSNDSPIHEFSNSINISDMLETCNPLLSKKVSSSPQKKKKQKKEDEIPKKQVIKNAVYSVVFSKDNKYVIAGFADHSIYMWNLFSGSLSWKIFGSVSGLLFHTISTMNFDVMKPAISLPTHSGPVLSLAVSHSGIIASGSMDGTVRFWDRRKSRKRHIKLFDVCSNLTNSGWVNAVIVIDDPYKNTIDRVITASKDQIIRLWDYETDHIVTQLEGHCGAVYCLSLSKDNTLLASGSTDRTIKLWDMNSYELASTIKGHKSFITSLCFSPCEKKIIASSYDRTVKSYEITRYRNKDLSIGDQYFLCQRGIHWVDPSHERAMANLKTIFNQNYYGLLSLATENKDTYLLILVLDVLSEFVASERKYLPQTHTQHLQNALFSFPYESIAHMGNLWNLANTNHTISDEGDNFKPAGENPKKIMNKKYYVSGYHNQSGWPWGSSTEVQLTQIPLSMCHMLGLISTKKLISKHNLSQRITEEIYDETEGDETEKEEQNSDGMNRSVHVHGKVIPIKNIAEVGTGSFLATCVDVADELNDVSIFERRALEILLEFKWTTYVERLFIFLTCCCITLVILIVLYSYLRHQISNEGKIICLIIMVSTAIPLGMFEIVQFKKVGLSDYVQDPWNFIDVLLQLLLFCTILVEILTLYEIVPVTSASVYILWAVVTLLGNYKLIYFMRGFPQTGGLVRMMYQMSFDIRAFVIILIIMLVCFGNALYLITQMDTQGQTYGDTACELQADHAACMADAFKSVYYSSLHLFQAGMGSFDLDLFDSHRYSTLPTLLYVIYCVIQAILMVNLLIAIMSDSYDRIQSTAKGAWRLEQGKICLEIEDFLSYFYSKETMHELGWTPEWLHVLLQEDKSDIEDTEWEGRIKAIANEVNSQLGSKFANASAPVESVIKNKFSNMETKMEHMVKKINNIPQNITSSEQNLPSSVLKLEDFESQFNTLGKNFDEIKQICENQSLEFSKIVDLQYKLENVDEKLNISTNFNEQIEKLFASITVPKQTTEPTLTQTTMAAPLVSQEKYEDKFDKLEGMFRSKLEECSSEQKMSIEAVNQRFDSLGSELHDVKKLVKKLLLDLTKSTKNNSPNDLSSPREGRQRRHRDKELESDTQMIEDSGKIEERNEGQRSRHKAHQSSEKKEVEQEGKSGKNLDNSSGI